jgi:hypothetical protein
VRYVQENFYQNKLIDTSLFNGIGNDGGIGGFTASSWRWPRWWAWRFPRQRLGLSAGPGFRFPFRGWSPLSFPAAGVQVFLYRRFSILVLGWSLFYLPAARKVYVVVNAPERVEKTESACQWDKLVLTDGTILEGIFLGGTDETVKFQVGKNDIREYSRAQIASIVITPAPQNSPVSPDSTATPKK